MRQAVMTSPGKIEIRDVPAPVPGEGEVLLRIRRIGVCGSDFPVYHGLHPYTSYPVVQGHEVSGIVDALGSGVAGSPSAAGIAIGASATFMPQIVCGTCFH